MQNEQIVKFNLDFPHLDTSDIPQAQIMLEKIFNDHEQGTWKVSKPMNPNTQIFVAVFSSRLWV